MECRPADSHRHNTQTHSLQQLFRHANVVKQVHKRSGASVYMSNKALDPCWYVCDLEDGSTYKGGYKDGKKEGQGTYTFPSGTVYNATRVGSLNGSPSITRRAIRRTVEMSWDITLLREKTRSPM